MFGTVVGNNTNATAEAGEPAHAGIPAAHSVWYRWIATDTGLFSFTTSGSSFDTTMGVYTGSAVSALTQIAANDDSASFDTTSRVVFHADAGTEYFIAIDGKNNAVGITNLIWRQAAGHTGSRPNRQRQHLAPNPDDHRNANTRWFAIHGTEPFTGRIRTGPAGR